MFVTLLYIQTRGKKGKYVTSKDEFNSWASDLAG